MSRTFPSTRCGSGGRAALALALAALLAGCAGRRPALSESAQLQLTVRELLKEEESTPEYHEARVRIQDMGPEVDAVLLALARDRSVNPVIRSNALILLSERRSPGALGALERALGPESPPRLRTAAVLGLQRIAPVAPEAMRLIRGALQDPARTVRLNALTALDVTEVEAIRAVLEKERDREVRAVATQLITISEARGAPLAADRRGVLRTTSSGSGLDPQIVYRPGPVDPATGLTIGDLRLELPGALDVPLASTAIALGGVVPAFFSPDRAQVVFEDAGEIRVLDIPSRNARAVGPGVAPRVIPFSDDFVFLRERVRTPRADGQTVELRYRVYRAEFRPGGTEPVEIGELVAEARADLAPNFSPVRRMVVAETPEGSVLRGEGITTFLLPVSAEPTPR